MYRRSLAKCIHVYCVRVCVSGMNGWVECESVYLTSHKRKGLISTRNVCVFIFMEPAFYFNSKRKNQKHQSKSNNFESNKPSRKHKVVVVNFMQSNPICICKRDCSVLYGRSCHLSVGFSLILSNFSQKKVTIK